MGRSPWARRRIGLRFLGVLSPVVVMLTRLAVVLACAVTGSSSYQPLLSEVVTAFHNTGTNNLGQDYPSLPLIESGYPSETLVPASIPCVILKSVGYVESSWHQASYVIARGETGSTLVSGSCGYGIMQITSGMVNPGDLPADVQQRIAEDYKYNIAWGAKMLVEKWNYAPTFVPAIGNRDPEVAENWYYTAWAYNQWNFRNNPNNPDFPWPRVVPFSPGASNPSYSNYPYQELVWGRAAYRPVVNGEELWPAVALTLPPREEVGLVPQWFDTLSPSHESPCQILSVSSNSLFFASEPGTDPDPQLLTITNAGGGNFHWEATVSTGWLAVSPALGDTEPATLQVSVNSASLAEGQYSGTIQITADNVPGSPQTVTIGLFVGPLLKYYMPFVPKGYTGGPG